MLEQLDKLYPAWMNQLDDDFDKNDQLDSNISNYAASNADRMCKFSQLYTHDWFIKSKIEFLVKRLLAERDKGEIISNRKLEKNELISEIISSFQHLFHLDESTENYSSDIYKNQFIQLKFVNIKELNGHHRLKPFSKYLRLIYKYFQSQGNTKVIYKLMNLINLEETKLICNSKEKENMNKSMMLPFKFCNLKRAKISRAQTRKLHSSLDSYDRYRNFIFLPYVNV